MNSSNDDSSSVEQPTQPQMCSTGCGFFSNNTGMCSKCFRDSAEYKHQQSEAVVKSKVPVSKPSAESCSSAEQTVPIASVNSSPSASVATVALNEVPGGGAPPPAGPQRCSLSTCRKRVGLTGFKCKCDQLFCGTHRYAEAHSCEFDYKTVQRQKLAENNPLCVASKVQKL
ncbi:MAG: hypothetical protein WDW38_009726 [Sanguina aurantia]